jgi:hypothetical protein
MKVRLPDPGEACVLGVGIVNGDRATRSERWSRYVGRINNAFGLVLLLVIVTYAVSSLTRFVGWSAVAVTTVSCASGAVALGSSGMRAPAVRSGILLMLASIACAVIAALTDAPGFLAASGIIQTLLLAAATAAILRAVLSESVVSFRTILGAISVYMIFGLLFTSLYATVDRLQAGAFFAEGAGTGTGDLIFFSFTTLTTTGYGNLVPATQPGKMIAGLEMMLGQIFLVTLIAGLVSLWRPRSRREPSEHLSQDQPLR